MQGVLDHYTAEMVRWVPVLGRRCSSKQSRGHTGL